MQHISVIQKFLGFVLSCWSELIDCGIGHFNGRAAAQLVFTESRQNCSRNGRVGRHWADQDQDHCALLWNIVHLSTDDTHIAFEIRLKALYKPTVGEICALNLCCTGKEGDGWPSGRRWIGQTCLACVADSLAPRPTSAASIQHRAAIQTPYLTSATYFPFLLWPQLCICRNSTLCRRRGIAFHLFIFDNVQQQNTACTALCWTFISEFECCQS